jgi:glyoxylase-like metal-dependent hydrolase (beta-lactamase superfamily II)
MIATIRSISKLESSPMFTRRHFLGAGLAAPLAYAAGSFVPVWAQNAPNFGTPTLPNPGFRRMKVGEVEVISLIDGIARRPLGEEFVKNAPLAEVRALLASQNLPTDYIDVPFTPFLVVAGNRRILMDTGLGEFGGATTGKLLENLRAAGFQAGDIDTVLITHYHGDHIGGLRNKAGEFVFSKAKVMVPSTEHAFWMDDAKLAAAPEGMKGAFNNARRVFGQMPADMLVRFESGAEVLPGVKSVAAYGHTPGHTLFEVTSAGQTFAYVGDLTNVPALFARNPDWAVTFDMDAEAARQVRRATFQRIVASNAMIGGFHFPFPAFGRAVVAGNGYAFQPVA